MLTPTKNPLVYRVRLQDWDPKQPRVEMGVGLRSEVECRLSYQNPGLLQLEYIRMDFYERETPIIPWRFASSLDIKPANYQEHLIKSAVTSDLFALYHLEFVWNE